MEPMLLRLFQRQVADQCYATRLALNTADKALRVMLDIEAPGGLTEPVLTFWSAVGFAVSAAANVSKALWGPRDKPRVAAARQPLRESLGVSDDSPLRDVSMRNHFEHLDERLDRWWKNSPTHNFVDAGIGPVSGIVGVPDSEMFRTYDPATGNLVFWGELFNLVELGRQIDQLRLRAWQQSIKPH